MASFVIRDNLGRVWDQIVSFGGPRQATAAGEAVEVMEAVEVAAAPPAAAVPMASAVALAPVWPPARREDERMRTAGGAGAQDPRDAPSWPAPAASGEVLADDYDD